MSRNYFQFVKRKYKDFDGKNQLKALKSNIVTVPIEMLLSKGNPLLATINRVLLGIVESGLIDYWTGISTSKQQADAMMGERTEKILTLETLKGGFLLWMLGIGLSCLAFLGEVVVHKRKKHK